MQLTRRQVVDFIAAFLGPPMIMTGISVALELILRKSLGYKWAESGGSDAQIDRRTFSGP